MNAGATLSATLRVPAPAPRPKKKTHSTTISSSLKLIPVMPVLTYVQCVQLCSHYAPTCLH